MTPHEVRADFPAEPASAGHARRFVDRALTDWSCGELAEVATLLVSELVANAILHAGTTVHVVVRGGEERVRIEVHDGNVSLPTRKHYSKLSATGRGLVLVEKLSRAWGTESTPSGKMVWFELDQSVPSADAVGIWDVAELALDLEGLAPADKGRPGNDDPESAEGGNGPRLRSLSRA
ncbi:MAG: ATP-binding protein [Acidimicrobiales bacterium]